MLKKLRDVNFRIQEKDDGTMKVIHHQRLKPYASCQPPAVIPQWVWCRSRALEVTEISPADEGDFFALPR